MMHLFKTSLLALGAMALLAGSAHAYSYAPPVARSQCACAPGACAAGQCNPHCAHCTATHHHRYRAVQAYQPMRPVQHWQTAARPVFQCGTPVPHAVPRYYR